MHAHQIRDTLLKKAGTLRIIPTLGNAAQKVFRAPKDPDRSFAKLHNVLKYDLATSSKIISIANCTYYNRGTEVYTLDKAMAIIGFDEAKKIATCIPGLDTISDGFQVTRDDFLDLWKHSIFVASASRTIASRTFIDDPEKAFAVGLLHDIGKIIFYAAIEDYKGITKRAALSGKDVSTVENSLFSITHGEIGWHIAKKWGLPEEFLTVIRHHHESGYGGAYRDVVTAVKAADRISLSLEHPSDVQGLILSKEISNIEEEVQKAAALLITPETQ
jgi:putative nucleotidyltransferase with HDIG domain